MDHNLQDVFIDESYNDVNPDTGALPLMPMAEGTNHRMTWDGEAFKNIYNTRWGDAEDYEITWDNISGSSLAFAGGKWQYPSNITMMVTQPLIETMDVIGDDEDDPSYREWVYQQSGSWLPIDDNETLGFRSKYMKYGWPGDLSIVNTNAQSSTDVPGTYAHLMGDLTMSFSMNKLCIEPTILVVIGAVRQEPYIVGTISKQYPEVYGTAANLKTPDLRLLATMEAWIPRFGNPNFAGVDSLDDLLRILSETFGDIGGLSTLNYFEGGEVLHWDADDATKELAIRREAAGAVVEVDTDTHDFGVRFKGAVLPSILTDIGLFGSP
jgi:hypothetical protein